MNVKTQIKLKIKQFLRISPGFFDLVLTLLPCVSTLVEPVFSEVGPVEFSAASSFGGLPIFFTTVSVFFGLGFLDSVLLLVLLEFLTEVLPLLLSRDFDFFVALSTSGNLNKNEF